jgi:endoglycosylceramidase
LACAVAGVLALPAVGVAAPLEGRLGQTGRWLTAPDGRVVVLHGVNMVYKRPPYIPAITGFGEDDARFLAEHGFNTVRLGLIYAGVEPSPGVYDDTYLERIAETVRILARHRIFVQLDFHQDLYNERFQGEGFPDWAVQDDGLPAEPKVGFPGNYPAMPALNRAFDNFWANRPGPGGVGLQDRYAAAWRHVAERFRDQPYLMGYDILNEPWPGSVWPTCANNLGCPLFDQGPLAGLSQKVISAIRQADRANIVWYEPNILFNFGADSQHPDTGDSRAGFSFHNYCLLAGVIPGASLPNPPQDETCGAFERNFVFENAEKQSRETGDALLLSEFGATDDLGLIRRLVDYSDDYRLSWQYWHYCTCDDPTTSGTGGVQALVPDPARPPGGANLRAAKLDVLARAYPQVVAGTPTAWDFDTDSKRFSLSYSTRGPGGRSFASGGVSEVFLPPRRYGNSYRVAVAGAEVASEPGASSLRLRNCAGSARVRLTVTDEAPTGVPDCAAQSSVRDDLPSEGAAAPQSRGEGAPGEDAPERAGTAGARAGELPFTGLDLRGLLAAGLLLLGAGTTLRAAGTLRRG